MQTDPILELFDAAKWIEQDNAHHDCRCVLCEAVRSCVAAGYPARRKAELELIGVVVDWSCDRVGDDELQARLLAALRQLYAATPKEPTDG